MLIGLVGTAEAEAPPPSDSQTYRRVSVLAPDDTIELTRAAQHWVLSYNDQKQSARSCTSSYDAVSREFGVFELHKTTGECLSKGDVAFFYEFAGRGYLLFPQDKGIDKDETQIKTAIAFDIVPSWHADPMSQRVLRESLAMASHRWTRECVYHGLVCTEGKIMRDCHAGLDRAESVERPRAMETLPNGVFWSGAEPINSNHYFVDEFYAAGDHIAVRHRQDPDGRGPDFSPCVGRLVAVPEGGDGSAPPLLRGSVALDDSITGGSGALETGENAEVLVRVSNDGPGVSRGVRVQLEASGDVSQVEFGQRETTLAVLLSGQQAMLRFPVTGKPGAGDGALHLKLTVEDANKFGISPKELDIKLQRSALPTLHAAPVASVLPLFSGPTSLSNGRTSIAYVSIVNDGTGPGFSPEVIIRPASKGLTVESLDHTFGTGSVGLVPASASAEGSDSREIEALLPVASRLLCPGERHVISTSSGGSAWPRSAVPPGAPGTGGGSACSS